MAGERSVEEIVLCIKPFCRIFNRLPGILTLLSKGQVNICKKCTHRDSKVASSHAKIDEIFANYFLKNKVKNKCFTVLKITYIKTRKSIKEFVEIESKSKVLFHFKVYPVLKIDATFYNSLDLCVVCTLYKEKQKILD